MTRKKDFSINFSGITHDHNSLSSDGEPDDESGCSTIAILRRHPMYDCLVLVKRKRDCINGYALEFPTSKSPDDLPGSRSDDRLSSLSTDDPVAEPATDELAEEQEHRGRCSRRKLVSRFLDGDDLMYQSFRSGQESGVEDAILAHPFSAHVGDLGQNDELVHVPVNGLLDRLRGYTANGIAVDSRVYAFAMGLKTAERLLATGLEKEIQETPKI